MLKIISSISLLALTAFYSINLYAQPGPRGPQQDRGPGKPSHARPDVDRNVNPYQQRGPQSRPSHGPQQRGPQSRPSHGPQQRGPQSRPSHGPQQRGPQSRPSHGPQQRGPQGQARPNPGNRPPAMAVKITPEVQAQINRIREAVASGKISREDAMKKFAELRRTQVAGHYSKLSPAKKTQPHLQQRPPQKPGANSGKQWQGKPQSAHGDAKSKTNAGQFGKQYVQKIHKAVAAGDLTKEEAAKKIAALRQKMATRDSQAKPQSRPQPQARPQARPQTDRRPSNAAPGFNQEAALRVRQAMAKAVENGEMTREQAAERFRQWMQRQQEAPQRGVQTDRAPQERPQSQPQARPQTDRRPATLPPAIRAEAGKLMLELRKAVEAGEMTREQAAQRFNRWRQQYGTQAPQAGPDRSKLDRPATNQRPSSDARPARAVPATPAKPAKAKPAQPAKPATPQRKQAIQATKIQPAPVFQLPPEKIVNSLRPANPF